MTFMSVAIFVSCYSNGGVAVSVVNELIHYRTEAFAVEYR